MLHKIYIGELITSYYSLVQGSVGGGKYIFREQMQAAVQRTFCLERSSFFCLWD